MNHLRHKLLGFLLILLAIGAEIFYPENFITPFAIGGLFGGGFVLLFGIGRRPKKK